MKKNKNDHFILMFLTDGNWIDDTAINDKTLTASQRVATLKNKYEKFSFYGIQFGSVSERYQILKKMAVAGGNEEIKDATMPTDLGNFFIAAVAKEIDVSLMHRDRK